MRYEIGIHYNSRSAKSKALAGVSPSHPDTSQVVIVEAKSDEDAWRAVLAEVLPQDRRPIAGKSYIRGCRVASSEDSRTFAAYSVGDRVVLHVPYADYGQGGHRQGVISEVLGGALYCITLDGYHNPHVDFHAREFAKAR